MWVLPALSEEHAMVARRAPRQLAGAWGLCVLVLVAGGCSSTSNPTQPTPVAAANTLEHFEQLVGTSWTGTATYTSGGGQPSRVSVAFIWGGTCYVPGWCMDGYNSYGWGTVDDIRTRILGYNDSFTAGKFRRELYVGEPTLGTGHWDSSVLSADRQRLVIRSSDFAWDQRRGVTIELARAPWPADLDCPYFRNCGY
jgi:hypothetical protein